MQEGIHGPVACIEHYMLASNSCGIRPTQSWIVHIHCLKFHLPVLLEIWQLTEVEATGQSAESKDLTLGGRAGRLLFELVGKPCPLISSCDMLTVGKAGEKEQLDCNKVYMIWEEGRKWLSNYPLLRDGRETEISHGLLSIAGDLFTLTICCFSSLDLP